MASALCSSMAGLSLGHAAVLSQRRIAFGASFSGSGNQSRGRLVIVAAQNAKKRQRTGKRNRIYNKARKSAVATRVKKVLRALDGYSEGVQEEAELQPIQILLNEAYQEIDKAVVKGIMHRNTAARRKSRMALARQKLLISSGLYTPAAAAK